MKLTREQIAEARALAPFFLKYEMAPAMREWIEKLLAATETRSAELEAEQAAHQATRDLHTSELAVAHEVLTRAGVQIDDLHGRIKALVAERDAERAAHAETLACLDESTAEAARLRRERDELLTRLVAEEKAHADARTILEASRIATARLGEMVDGFQVATGCATPEEFTRRCSMRADALLPDAAEMAWVASEADEPCVHTIPSMQTVRDLIVARLAPVLFASAEPTDSDERLILDNARNDPRGVVPYLLSFAASARRSLQERAREACAEPTDEEVERYSKIFLRAGCEAAPPTWQESEWDKLDPIDRAGITSGMRAVLRSMPALTLPSEEEIALTIRVSHECGDGFDETARTVLDLMRKRGAERPSDDQRAPLDQRTPEEKAAGVARALKWLDNLPEEWRGLFDEMKAKRVAQTNAFGQFCDSDFEDGLVADAAGNVCSLDGRVLLCGDPRAAAEVVKAFNRPSDEQLADEAARHANDVLKLPADTWDLEAALEIIRSGNTEGDPWCGAVRSYAAGARREGRQ